MRILLIEDHADTAEAMQRMLRSEGYETRVAPTIAEAKRLCIQDSFDLVLSDIHLPDGDGCTLMKDVLNKMGVACVAVSASGYPADKERCRVAGFSSHLTKPVEIDHLLDVVKRAMERQQPARSAIHHSATPVA